MTNLVISMTPCHRKMGLWDFTCIGHVTHQFHHQIRWIEPGSTKRSLVTLLRVYVRHQVQKCERATLSVMMRQVDNCPTNISTHQSVGPSMTKQSVVDACKFWTKAPQNYQTEPGAHNLQLTAKSMVFIIMVKLMEEINQENILFSCCWSSYWQDKSPTQKSGKAHAHYSYHWHIPPADVLHLCFTQAVEMLWFEWHHSNSWNSSAGPVDQALRGRPYWRGLCCILRWREVLIQKHLSQILQYEDLRTAAQHSLNTVHNVLTATQVTLPEANSCLEYDVFTRHLITEVYEKPDKDMGDFWISFVEMPDPLLRFIEACHARNFNEYLSLTYSLLLD